MLISDAHSPHPSPTLSGAIPDPAFAEAARRVAGALDRAGACSTHCPIAAPLRDEIAPAVIAGAVEPLWRATLAHAQTALGCRRDCPAVDMMRAVLAATRLAYRAAG